MPLASVEDVRQALAAPDATATTAAALPDSTLEAQVEEAEGIVRIFLAGYAIPTDADGYAPQPVRGWVRNIAAYHAHLVWARNKDVPVNEPNRLRFTETMRLLSLIQEGKLILGFEPVEGSIGEGGGADATVFNLYEGRLWSAEDFVKRAEFGERGTRYLSDT